MEEYTYHETEEYEAGFAEYYQEKILPIALKYDGQRPKKLIRHRVNIALAVSSGTLSLLAFFKFAWLKKLAAAGRKTGGIILFPPLFLWWFLVHKPKRRYFEQIKEEVTPIVLKFLGDFQYRSEGVVESVSFGMHGTHPPPLFNLAQGEDVIEFNHNRAKITIIERQFWDPWKPLGNIYVLIDLNHSSYADFALRSRNVEEFRTRPYNGRLRKQRPKLRSVRSLGQEFDNSFIALSSCEDTIGAWITDEFLAILKQLDKAFEQKGLFFSIIGSHILIQFRSRGNYFEPGFSYAEPILTPVETKRYLKELHFAIEISKFFADYSAAKAEVVHLDTIQ